jgi:hypothetical protein
MLSWCPGHRRLPRNGVGILNAEYAAPVYLENALESSGEYAARVCLENGLGIISGDVMTWSSFARAVAVAWN